MADNDQIFEVLDATAPALAGPLPVAGTPWALIGLGAAALVVCGSLLWGLSGGTPKPPAVAGEPEKAESLAITKGAPPDAAAVKGSPSGGTPKVATVQTAAVSSGPLGAKIGFAFNHAEFKTADAIRLRSLAASVGSRPGRFRIEGFADSYGPADYNLRLSQRRAAAVGALLRSSSAVAAHKFHLIGRGTALPRGSNATAAGRAANRRVEVTFEPS